MLRPLLIVGPAALGLLAGLSAAEPARAKPDPVAVERLVRQLGSESYAEREAASRQLRSLGRAVLPALEKATDNADPEVRTRARRTPPLPPEVSAERVDPG